MVGVFLEQVEIFLDRGIYFIRIVEGYETVFRIVVGQLEKIVYKFEFGEIDVEFLIQICMIILLFKMYVQLLFFVFLEQLQFQSCLQLLIVFF